MSKPSDWRRIKAISLSVLDLRPEDRARLLDVQCGDDEELRRAVMRLVEAAEAESDFLVPPDLLAARPAIPEQRRVGPWELVETIDSGGMGTVYRGRRADGAYEQDVAIKVIRAGLQSPPLRARFERERQLLARLDHPNITRLIDGGTTEEGQPYLVMEYVSGQPILKHCTERALALRPRLELFLQVCSAVEHAHRCLVVHRDLKPSNVLITPEGQPKLLDFGIAKLLDPEGATSDETQTLLRALTPAYASPEQLRDEPVTTASDVYSLGVLLYELITGSHPHDLEGCSRSEARRVICTTDPLPPSQAGEPPRTRHRKRRPRAPTWRRRLRGDLDNVVLMALRKEPERRYSSVEQLASDIENYLADLPVQARRATPAYRVRKFLRRHPLGAGSAAALVLALATAIVGTSAGLARAEEQRARAEAAQREAKREFEQAQAEAIRANRVLTFLSEMLRFGTAEQGRRADVTVREMLDHVSQRIDQFADDPRALATILETLGAAYHGLGLYEESERHLRQSVEVVTGQLDGQLRRQIEARTTLAGLYLEQLELPDAQREIDRAVDLMSTLPEEDLVRASVLNTRALIRRALTRYAQAEEDLRRALEIREKTPGEGHPSALLLKQNLAEVLSQQSKRQEASLLLEECIAILRTQLPASRLKLAGALNNLGSIVSVRDAPAESLPLYEEALEHYQLLFDGDHPSVAISLNNLASAHRDLGEHERARQLFEQALALFEKYLAPTHPHVGIVHQNLGGVHVALGEGEVACAHYRRALEIQETQLPPTHSDLLSTRLSLGQLLLELDRPEEASEPLEALRKQFLLTPPKRAGMAEWVEVQLAVCQIELGEVEEGMRRLEQSAADLERIVGADHDWTKHANQSLHAHQSPNGTSSQRREGDPSDGR